MINQDSLWDDVIYDPGVEVGPALSEAAIAAWQEQRGVALPSILKRAYQQQDGGYLRGVRAICLLPLREIEPVEPGYLDNLRYGNEDGHIDPNTLFYFGGDDDQGATLLLHYGEPDGTGPAVYAHCDGDSIELLAATVDTLFNNP